MAAMQLGAGDLEFVRVYPPLGLARVGDAPGEDDYLISPEVIGGVPTKLDGSPAATVDDYRDNATKLKRHAARFRVYARTKSGDTIELTTKNVASVRWKVGLANLKAGWYNFLQAMDLGALSKPAERRNRQLPRMPGGRQWLDIVPSPVEIAGENERGDGYAFADGVFGDKQVYLGELRTDADGRLIVLGGRGVCASFKPELRPTTFANNFGWHDDTSDGPVRATITFRDGSEAVAEPGYVAVAPPNYAPEITPIVTMDDAVRELFMDLGWIQRPTTTSFAHDVWPIFDRMTGMQWVNHGFFMMHGTGSPLDAQSATVLERLRDRSAANAPWRDAVVALFSDGTKKPNEHALIPQVYGDAYGETPDDSDPRARLVLTRTQREHLTRWAAGDFDDSWSGSPKPPPFAALKPEAQVENLERAALHACLGGPFHPGIELTWTMRLPRVWKGPYRLKVLDAFPAKQDYGAKLTPEVCVAENGPYDGVAAGALTRFMGVPWHTDEASCNSSADYAPWTFLSMPSFWGARVPDQVLAEANVVSMMRLDAAQATQRNKHFTMRSDWLRDVRGRDYYDRIRLMVQKWSELGMVLPLKVHSEAMQTEQGRTYPPANDPKQKLMANAERLYEAEPQLAPVVGPMRFAPEPEREAPPPREPFRQDEV
jgi:hypothetical protein